MREEGGFILVLTLVMLLVVTLLGFSAMSASIFEVKMGANDLTSKKAFYAAEAGWNEFTARFKAGEIEDHASTNTLWKRFIAPTEERVRKIGYDSGDPDQLYIQSTQHRLDYAVVVTHQVDSYKVVTKAGYPVYVVRSHGWSGEGNKVVEVTLHRCPNLDPPGALYSKTSIYVKGSSTYINGNDFCGVSNRPGIITTTDTIAASGTPLIDGLPPMVTHSPLNLALGDYVNYFKEYANVNYSYMDDKTLTGLDFGGLTGGNRTEDRLKPTGSANVVYFNMNAVNTIKLAGGCHGAGLLLVDGNLEINGRFAWFGVIFVTGALTFTGGGEKNITGGVLAGEMTSLEVDIAGNAAILYCSEVRKYLKDRFPAFKIAHWRRLP